MLSYWFKSVGVGFQEHVSDRSGRDNEFDHVITRGRFNFARSRSKHVAEKNNIPLTTRNRFNSGKSSPKKVFNRTVLSFRNVTSVRDRATKLKSKSLLDDKDGAQQMPICLFLILKNYLQKMKNIKRHLAMKNKMEEFSPETIEPF